MTGRQRNHLAWVLPDCLAPLGLPPLYLAVAWWGLLRDAPFGRADVSEAFCIPPRRAADVIDHMLKGCGGAITATTRVARGERPGRVKTLVVHEIRLQSPLPALQEAAREARKDAGEADAEAEAARLRRRARRAAQAQDAQAMMQALLRRPVGGGL